VFVIVSFPIAVFSARHRSCALPAGVRCAQSTFIFLDVCPDRFTDIAPFSFEYIPYPLKFLHLYVAVSTSSNSMLPGQWTGLTHQVAAARDREDLLRSVTAPKLVLPRVELTFESAQITAIA